MPDKSRTKLLAPGVYLVHESNMSSYLKASEEALISMYEKEKGHMPNTNELNQFASLLQER